MKYYLCLKKYPYKHEEISGFLPESDCHDLKKICDFTMQFATTNELLDYLISKGLIDSKAQNREVVIIYNYRCLRELRIPLKDDKRFFTMNNVINEISMRVSKDSSFIEYFCLRPSMPDIYHEIRNSKWQSNIHDKVARFINIMCYNRGKFSFKTFFDIAMFLASINRIKKRAEAVTATPSKPSLSETEEFELEHLLTRQRKFNETNDEEGNEQLSLF